MLMIQGTGGDITGQTASKAVTSGDCRADPSGVENPEISTIW